MRAPVLIVALAGCNTILGIPTVSNEVHGKATDTYWQAMTMTDVPRDFSKWQVAVLVVNSDASGGFDGYGAQIDTGTFEVPAVPDGPFYLKLVPPGGVPRYL